MLTLDVRLKLNGRDLSLKNVAEFIISRFVQEFRKEIRTFVPPAPPPVYQPPQPQKTESQKSQPKAVGIDEAARLLGIRPSTVRAYVSKRRIHFIRIGRRVLIPVETIDKILSEGLAKPMR